MAAITTSSRLRNKLCSHLKRLNTWYGILTWILSHLQAHLNQYNGVMCQNQNQQDCCLTLALEEAIFGNQNNNDGEQDDRSCKYLNAVGAAYFDGGVVQMQELGVFNYMSTRNNNFSNRSQKGKITVGTLLPVWYAKFFPHFSHLCRGIVIAAAGGVAFIAGCVVAGGVYFAQTHPQSSVANIFGNVRI